MFKEEYFKGGFYAQLRYLARFGKSTNFRAQTTGIEKSHLEKTGVDHHTHNKKDNHTDSDGEHFFRDLAVKIKEAEQLLIMGPGLAKNHFKTHLQTHHTGDLAKRIIGVENSDHPTDKQILAVSRRFFQKYNLFDSPIQPGK